MSELAKVRGHRNTARKHLLATVSALALVGYIAGTNPAKAENTDRPTVWIELGGQMEILQGTSSNFTAPFMSAKPDAGPYTGDFFIRNQRPPRLAMGFEGKAIFQPANSNWLFMASLRYGRSQTNRHVHNQTLLPSNVGCFGTNCLTKPIYAAPFADAKAPFDESHTILDFSAGREVGIGAWGRDGTSDFDAGVRFAQFSSKSSLDVEGRPTVDVFFATPFGIFPKWKFDQYAMQGHADRSFHGIGPSLSWNASAALLGNRDVGEVSLDWGVNVALLFGRQSAKTDHGTTAYHFAYPSHGLGRPHTSSLYLARAANSTRSRSVVVPNLGGFAGFSVKYPNIKVSLGYRADFFFGAVDAGIDERHTKDLGFQGPFATVSIGLGG